MLIQGKCDDVRFGPVLDVAVGPTEAWTYGTGSLLTWVRGAFNPEQERTAIRSETRYDLKLRESDGTMKVLLLFQERDGHGLALLRDIEAVEIDAFGVRQHKWLLNHNPEIQVVFGQDVLSYGDLLVFPSSGDNWEGKFVFSVDTGTGITPVRVATAD